MECIEELNKRAFKQEKKKEHTGAIDRHRFQELHQEGRKLIRNWAERATSQINCVDKNSFEPFIFGWIAINGWATCVTGKDNDYEYLYALELDDDLTHKFENQLKENTEFKEAAQDFQRLWPIFKSKDVGNNAAWSGTRQQIIQEYEASTPLAARTPECWSTHRKRGEEIPTDWLHTLSAIYRVRCNLFHGYKGVYLENDVVIVSRAFRVLARLLPMLINS